MNFFEASDQLKNVGTKEKVNLFESKYKWNEIPVGKSIAIPAEENINFKNLRAYCYRMSKKLNKKFRAIQHDNGIIELGCLADYNKEPAQQPEANKLGGWNKELGGCEDGNEN